MTTEPSDDRFITLLLANQSRVFRFLFTLSTAAAAGRSANALYRSLRRIRAILHDCMLRVLAEGSTS